MTLDPTDQADILDWIGTVQDGENLEDTYDLRGGVEATALSILKRRRASLGPDSWSLSGDYSESDGGRRAAWLDAQIARLSALLGQTVDPPIGTGRIRRVQPCR